MEKYTKMKDNLGRNIDYLRISITDRCNLRCKYCMGEDVIFLPKEEILTSDEIGRVVKIFSELGIKKVRITGGEPLVRRNFRDIIENIDSVQNIEEINITTNGIRLKEELEFLKSKKIKSLNISLDTLDSMLYKNLTGGDFDKVWDAIKKALELEFEKIKLNVVLIKGVNEKEILKFVGLTEKYNLDVRFIELMPIGMGKSFEGISNDEVKKIIEREKKLTFVSEKCGLGPATYYSVENSRGKIGFINPLSHSFCDSCNRIRITPEGFLKLCLHWKVGLDLKKLLRENYSDQEIKEKICEIIEKKPTSHYMLEKEKSDEFEVRNMNGIGG